MPAHARVLEILVARDDPDLPRVVHHAVQAGDRARVVELAPLARAGRDPDPARSAADHHVSAVLAKLGVTNRRAVMVRAPDLGLDEPTGM